jgi:FAD:protein FMN transferase
VHDPISDSFPAMGTTCRVTLVGGNEALLGTARRRVDELEARWSRFRDDSEITRLNHRSGRATALSADGFLLVDHAVAAWRATGGRYDPTVLHALESAGYDRSFEQIGTGRPGGDGSGRGAAEPAAGSGTGHPAPGCGAVVLDTALRTVTLPPGVGFDPGGIGKGLAADLVVDLLLEEGARGACVDLGGDGRMAGEPPPGGWRVGVGDPHDPDRLLAIVTLTDHGIATSSRLIRRWDVEGVTRHHLLDPRTGASLDNGLDAVTVIAPDAWVAEILTKAAYVAGPGDAPALMARLGGEGLLVESTGRMTATARFADFVAEEPAPATVG